MLIPPFFIEKAFEGGYPKHSNPEWEVFQSSAVIDPLFWQAMGKALDWDNKKITVHVKLDARNDLFRVGRLIGNGKRSPTVRFSRQAQSYSFQKKPRKDRWKRYSKDFFNILIHGGYVSDIQEFWSKLKDK